MDAAPPSLRREFLRSPHHAWLALLTAGAGFLGSAFAQGAAVPLLLLGGLAAYVLGWVYLPDSGVFTRWVERKRRHALASAANAELADFVRRRERLIAELAPNRRQRYAELAAIYREIEQATAKDRPPDGGEDPRLRKLVELLWTYLRLLSIEQSLDRLLANEIKDDVRERLRENEKEIAQITAEIERLQREGKTSAAEAKERLRASRLELLEVLKKRVQKVEEATTNLEIVGAEEERLSQQIKLIRADALAVTNTAALSARIDSTVEQLEETNKWLSQLDQFKDAVGDAPPPDARPAYAVPPPLPQEERPRVPPEARRLRTPRESQ